MVSMNIQQYRAYNQMIKSGGCCISLVVGQRGGAYVNCIKNMFPLPLVRSNLEKCGMNAIADNLDTTTDKILACHRRGATLQTPRKI